jgi:xanthine dehydrogenase iron-sulfur cluster and FAD-binding subunit A
MDLLVASSWFTAIGPYGHDAATMARSHVAKAAAIDADNEPMTPPPLRYLRPGTVEQAVASLGARSRPLAGGQSLMPLLNLRQRDLARVVDLAAIGELQRLAIDGDMLAIGAGVTMARLERSPLVRRHAPVLVDALALVGNPQVRARGTAGGNVAHADPVSEVITTLVALGGRAVVRGLAGRRVACVQGLTLSDKELLVELRVPMQGDQGGAILEVSARYAARALVVAVAVVTLAADGTIARARVAVGGMAAAPAELGADDVVRGLDPEDAGVASALADAVDRLPPVDDPRADADYRREVGAELAARAVREAAARVSSDGDIGRKCGTGTYALADAERGGPFDRDFHAVALDEEHTGEVEIALTVNGENRRARVTPRTLLSDLVRGPFGLTATHVGCEHGVCGACNVLVDGTAIRSCLMLAVQADGRSVQTLEGLRDRPEVAELIDRFVAEHSLQCGFCTPGFIVTLAELRRNRTSVTPDRLIGNICRCTGYAPILRASRGRHERV